MIATPGGVENLDAILKVPGVDALYVGPSDLALGHGMTPTLNATEPDHVRLIETIVDHCRRRGIVAGILWVMVRTRIRHSLSRRLGKRYGHGD
jgi:4-hydroxy-2-oxoheptanedioate aldolase